MLWLALGLLALVAWNLRDRIARLERELDELRTVAARMSRPAPAQPIVTPPAAPVEARVPAARPIASAPAAPPAAPPKPPAAPLSPTPLPSPAAAPPPVSPPPPPPQRPPQPPRPPAGPPPAPKPAFDWERLVGVRLFSAVAGLALAVAAVFFLRYSVEHGWLQPPVRVAIGILTAVVLLIACELKAARNYPLTANAMDASAVAILFSTFFAANALWHLIGAGTAFALMALVTALAVLLSIRRDSLFIALLGLVGGFSTPALLSTGENRPFALFGYLLLLNAGLAWVAYRKKWPFLTALSLAFTVFYQWGWVLKFLAASSVGTGIAIFLVFPVFSFVALALAPEEPAGKGRWAPILRHVPTASAALPLIFSVYLAAVPAYAAHFGLLFGFTLLLVIGLAAIAATRGPAELHLLGALSALIVWAVWLGSSYAPAAWPVVLLWIAAFVLFFLAVPVAAGRPSIAARFPGAGALSAGRTSYGVYAAPLLLFAFPALILAEPRALQPGIIFAALILLLAACAAYAIARSEGGVHFLAAFFALAAEAVWSGRALTADRLLPALAVYGAFGLFYIGVPVLARRRGHPLRPQGAGGVLALVSIALLLFLAGGAIAQTALWGIALLLAILNAGLFLESSASRMPLLSLAGLVLSWIVIAVWWFTATVALALLPALVVLGGFSLLALAGNVWARAREPGDAGTAFDRGVYLGLIGHLFLLFVASESSLSVPPWPLLGVLFVLDLAVATAALAMRRGELHLAAVLASDVVLLVWLTVTLHAPWPSVAIVAAAAVIVLAYAWLPLARRVGADMSRFTAAAGLAAILAQLVAVNAANAPGSPALTFLIAAQVAFIVAALVIASRDGFGILAVAAVGPAALAVLLWQDAQTDPALWRDQLTFALPILLVFLLYPEARRARGAIDRNGYLAAVLASAAFFIEARDAIRFGGHNDVIGILPVGEAFLLAGLLVGLLRRPKATAAPLGTVALVAGAALAYITIAIPLQLEKHWITVGWALEAAALAWLYRRVPHRGLLAAAGGLFVAVFVRLALNPAIFTYEPRGELRIWNWYLYTYLLAAAAFFFGAAMLAATDDRPTKDLPRLSALLPGGATILLFLLLNIEIADYFATGRTITFNFTASLGQDLTYTLGWAAFSVAMLAAGIVRRSKLARIAAIALLAVTVLKAFLHDLARLGGLYRVASFVGLAVCLILVALAIQKFVLSSANSDA